MVINASCTKKVDNNEKQSNNSESNNPTLTIYLMQWDKQFEDALGVYDGINIEAKYFNNIDEYLNKITTEILSGEGPDILKISNNEFNSVPKLLSSGAFCDLNQLIKEDKEFNLSNYNKTVLDSGVFEGKRYLLPIDYSMSAFCTTKSALNKNNIQIDSDNWNWNTMVELSSQFIDRNKGTGKYLFGPYYGTAPYFEEFILGSEVKFYDIKSKKSNFNSADFIELLKVYKNKIYPAICPNNNEKNFNPTNIDLLANNKVIMIRGGAFGYGGVQELFKDNSYYKKFLGEEMEVYPIPAFKTNKTVNSSPYNAFGISSKCKYKKAAFEYIKKLLSEEFYKQHYDNYNNYATVNNKAFQQELTYYSDSLRGYSIYSGDKGPIEMVPLPKKLSNQLKSTIANMHKCEFSDVGIERIVRDDLKKYLEGKITAEQCAKSIDNRCIIYLNE